MQTYVMYERQDDIAYLTFVCKQPSKPATLDVGVLDELSNRLTEARCDDGLRTLVIRSDSAKYFVVGADVRALETLDQESIVPWVEKGHQVFGELESLPIPTLARVEGYALGGGLELAMACDLIIASTEARLGQPEARLGFVAGWGGTYRLPLRVGAARAKELLFTGRIIDAERAHEIGLVDFVGDSVAVDGYLAAFFQDLRKCSPMAVREMKGLVNRSSAGSMADCIVGESAASCACLANDDTKRRVAAFLASRKKG
jgi:enoyl-CoA hydratase